MTSEIFSEYKFKILLLEDQKSDADQIARLLNKSAIASDILVVDSRDKYKNALLSYGPDVILSDHNLHNFSSLEALRWLKESGLTIPFILVTGTVSEEFAVEAMQAGIDDYILKDRMQRLPIAITSVIKKFQLAMEQKLAEAQIRESEAKYRALFENSLDGMLLTKTEGTILSANPAACEILQMTEAEICQKGRFGIIDACDPRVAILISERQQRGRAKGEISFIRKDGGKFPVELSSAIFIDALGHERTSIVFRDITERKLAEERILYSSQAAQKALLDLKKLQDSSLDMICAVNEHGFILRVSAACESILGYTQNELTGKLIFDFVYPEDLAKTQQSAQLVMTGENVRNFENRYVRKDGSIVHLVWSTRWDPADRVRYGAARDVTERKKAERVIASERRRLSDLVMNAPVAMCILKGRDHVFELANPIYLENSGKKDVVGKPSREVFPEFKVQGIIDLLDSVYRTGEPVAINEIELKVDQDGSGELTTLYQNMLLQPYRDADGDIEGIFYFGIDITEQVIARRKIEETEQRYRQIVETAQEGIWVVDENDVTTFVNKKLCELFEYDRDEMMGKEIYHFMDVAEKNKAASGMKMRRQGVSGIGNFKYISKSGRELWTNISANPLFDEFGVYKGSLAMITDVTDQKKTAEENKKLAMVASLTVNAVIVTDSQGRITWVNHGFERMTEFTLDEVAGKKPGDFLQGANTDPAVKRLMSAALKEEKGFRVEIINYSKSGRQYWLDIEVVPLHDANNALTGFMAIEQDITERKKAQKEAQTLIENLEQRNNNLQQFSYIVSHNLRAPISKIMGLANAVETEDPENKLLIDKIAEEADNLDDVIKDMNTIIAARQLEKVKLEHASFAGKTKKVIQILEDQIAESNAQIHIDFSQAEEIFTIKSYLFSILYNLVSNAIKYRNAGVPLVINISTSQAEDFICLTVGDNGIGIDLNKNKDKLFGLYKRFHGNTIPGRGMGLHLVKTHTESLGGKIEIQSELNKGTTFRIYIPQNYGKDLE